MHLCSGLRAVLGDGLSMRPAVPLHTCIWLVVVNCSARSPGVVQADCRLSDNKQLLTSMLPAATAVFPLKEQAYVPQCLQPQQVQPWCHFANSFWLPAATAAPIWSISMLSGRAMAQW